MRWVIGSFAAGALLVGVSSLGLAQSNPPAQQNASPSAAQEKSAAGDQKPAAATSRNAVSDETKKNNKEGSSGSSTAEATPGRNSFTEGQAKSRIEKSGFQNVTGLKKDENGIWTGQAMKDGRQVTVQLDFQGDVLMRQ
jgi:hypothetical protein